MDTTCILYSQVSANPTIDDLDIVKQADLVSAALVSLGFRTVPMSFSMDITRTAQALSELRPLFVFNLVEPVESEGNSGPTLAVSLFECLGVKFTGCPLEAISVTMNKPLAKKLLALYGIPTPEWISVYEDFGFITNQDYIVKPTNGCGSVGIDDNPIVSAINLRHLKSEIIQRWNSANREYFAERYIDGREFLVSILGSTASPKILPLAELKFTDFEENHKKKIFSYNAKWIADSFEYQHIRASYKFEEKDYHLLQEILRISKVCWKKLRLRGYASINFRVDNEGKPWVLEINTNPCLTPHPGGLIEAATEAKMDFLEIIKEIISNI